jgi:phospholipid/cholesterol/gamma-HCH transport system substrate-binding protein
MTLRTGKLNIRKDGYPIFVVFDDAAGLEKKAPVLLNGFTVGKVDDMNISYENNATRVILKLLLDKETKIRSGATVSIKTLGLMGEKFVKITSGEGPDYLAPGVTLEGKPFGDLDTLMEQAQGISRGVDELVGNLNGLSKDVQKLAQNLNTTVEGNQDRISVILKNVEVTTKNFEEFSGDLKAHPWKLLFKTKEKK